MENDYLQKSFHIHFFVCLLAALAVSSLPFSCSKEKQENTLADSGTEITGQNAGQGTSYQALRNKLAELVPPGWKLSDTIKQYTPETLYELINGSAELYLAYNVATLTYANYIHCEHTHQFVQVFVYDMGEPANAFGIFSVERTPGEPSLALGRKSYRSGASCFVWHGQYYIIVFASESSEEFQKISLDLAGKVTSFLPDPGDQVRGLSVLPAKDLVPDSVQYFKVDAMGLDFMQNTYTASYLKEGAEVKAFLSRQKTLEAARAVISKYADHARRYGKGSEILHHGGSDLLLCNMGATYDVLFKKDRLVGGVLSVENRDRAIQAAIELLQQLRPE